MLIVSQRQATSVVDEFIEGRRVGVRRVEDLEPRCRIDAQHGVSDCCRVGSNQVRQETYFIGILGWVNTICKDLSHRDTEGGGKLLLRIRVVKGILTDGSPSWFHG
jgi:hypothetical protein